MPPHAFSLPSHVHLHLHRHPRGQHESVDETWFEGHWASGAALGPHLEAADSPGSSEGPDRPLSPSCSAPVFDEALPRRAASCPSPRPDPAQQLRTPSAKTESGGGQPARRPSKLRKWTLVTTRYLGALALGALVFVALCWLSTADNTRSSKQAISAKVPADGTLTPQLAAAESAAESAAASGAAERDFPHNSALEVETTMPGMPGANGMQHRRMHNAPAPAPPKQTAAASLASRAGAPKLPRRLHWEGARAAPPRAA